MEAVFVNWGCGVVGGFAMAWLYCRTYRADFRDVRSEIDRLWNELEALGQEVDARNERLQAARSLAGADGLDDAAVEADLEEIAADLKGLNGAGSDKTETADLAW